MKLAAHWRIDLAQDLGYDPFDIKADGIKVVDGRVCVTLVDLGPDGNAIFDPETYSVQTHDEWHDLPEKWL